MSDYLVHVSRCAISANRIQRLLQHSKPGGSGWLKTPIMWKCPEILASDRSWELEAHTTPPVKSASSHMCNLDSVRRTVASSWKRAYPSYLTRWWFHGLFLMSNLHVGCTGIPALMLPGTPSTHYTCYQSPRNLLHVQGEHQRTGNAKHDDPRTPPALSFQAASAIDS